MSQDEQKQFDQLRDDLTCANQKIQESRSALAESHTESRLYRALFWSLLGLSGLFAVLRILR